jgi:hypothetical protein
MGDTSQPGASQPGAFQLGNWDPNQANLRNCPEDELLQTLASLGVKADRETLTAQAAAASMQSDVEDLWLGQCNTDDETARVLVWMSVHELWERYKLPYWPQDRLSRMFLYLIDPDFSVQWADNFHAPTIMDVLDAVEAFLAKQPDRRAAMDQLMAMAELPDSAWPGKVLDAMAEWAEVGNFAMAARAGFLLAAVLGYGHGLAFVAGALISARMMDRASAAALEVPLDAPLDAGFAELIAYLCLSAGDINLCDRWLTVHDAKAPPRKSEQTFAIETIRDHVAAWRQGGRQEGEVVPDKVRGAAKQAASWTSFYVLMSFAGTGTPGGVRGDDSKKSMADY